MALGARGIGRTASFSDTVRALAPAMKVCGVERLAAVTGVGAGETRGHGGFLYRRFLRVRPTMQRWVGRWEARGGRGVG